MQGNRENGQTNELYASCTNILFNSITGTVNLNILLLEFFVQCTRIHLFDESQSGKKFYQHWEKKNFFWQNFKLYSISSRPILTLSVYHQHMITQHTLNHGYPINSLYLQNQHSTYVITKFHSLPLFGVFIDKHFLLMAGNEPYKY